MNDLSPVSASNPADAHRVLRFLALAAVTLGVLALAAAAFVLSYPGIHALALTAGVSPALARIYPLAFDAMLVVASAAVLSLRGAGVITRCYAWLAMLLLLCAAAGADALHATGARLPHRAAAATVAIVPWVFVLLGFGLLLAMLRQARLHRAPTAQARAIAAPGTRAAGIAAQGIAAPVVPERTSAGHAATEPAAGILNGQIAETGPSAADRSGLPGAGPPAELALDAEPGHDDPTSDEAHPAGHSPARWVPRSREEDPLGAEDRYARDYPLPVMSPAPTAHVIPGRHAGPEPAAGPESAAGPEVAGATGPDPSAGPPSAAGPEPLAGPEREHDLMPVAHFDRMWSSPTPPDA